MEHHTVNYVKETPIELRCQAIMHLRFIAKEVKIGSLFSLFYKVQLVINVGIGT